MISMINTQMINIQTSFIDRRTSLELTGKGRLAENIITRKIHMLYIQSIYVDLIL